MSTDELFAFKLGQGVFYTREPLLKLVVVERLLAEFLDASKPTRHMFACKDLRTGVVKLHPQPSLKKWTNENQKIQPSSKENMLGEI